MSAPDEGRPMRVLLIGARGGGGEEVLLRELSGRPPQGITYTTVLDPHASVPGARASVAREIAFNRLLHPLLWPLPGLRAYTVGPEVDVVHVHNHPTWLRLPPGRPVVYSVGGGSYPHYLERYLGWSRPRVAARYRRARALYRPLGIRSEIATPERVDAVVALSTFAADRLREAGVPPSRLHVIPPVLEMPPPLEPRADPRPFTFLLVGRDPHRKGADLAVEAVRRLAARGLEVRLLLVGDEAHRALAEGDVVEATGPVPRERLFGEIYPAADAVLVPSRAEGFGLAAVEAMGAARPVIASCTDALPEIVGDAGLLVPPGDAGALAAAAERLVTSPAEAAALGRAARRRYEEHWAPERARALWGELYRTLAAGG